MTHDTKMTIDIQITLGPLSVIIAVRIEGSLSTGAKIIKTIAEKTSLEQPGVEEPTEA